MDYSWIGVGDIFMRPIDDDLERRCFYIVDWVDGFEVGYHNVQLITGTSMDLKDFTNNFSDSIYFKWVWVDEEEARIINLLYGVSHEEEKDE